MSSVVALMSKGLGTWANRGSPRGSIPAANAPKKTCSWSVARFACTRCDQVLGLHAGTATVMRGSKGMMYVVIIPPPGTTRAADSFWIDLRPGQQVIYRSNDVPGHEIENMGPCDKSLRANDLMRIARRFAHLGIILDLPLPLANGIYHQRYKSFPCLSDGPSLDLLCCFTFGGVSDDVEDRRMRSGALDGQVEIGTDEKVGATFKYDLLQNILVSIDSSSDASPQRRPFGKGTCPRRHGVPNIRSVPIPVVGRSKSGQC